MKKILLVFLSAAAVAVSCNKEALPSSDEGKEIVLTLGGEGVEFEVETKTTAITAVPSSLYLERTTGNWKSESAKNASASKTVSSGTISTGWVQTATATAYNYYVSNCDISFASGGSTISASNTTDVIAGCTQGATSSTTPSVTMEHVFARTGTLTCNKPDGFDSISSISWTIASKSGGTGGTAGTYNIATKAWSGVTALASQSITGSTDLYCTPGVYTITVTYTITKGDYTATHTKSGDVTLSAGKVNNISCTAPVDPTSSITLSVSLTGWSSDNVTLTLS